MAGVSPKAAQELMRHSDINLTMQTYTKLQLSDVASDLNKLPSMPTGDSQELRATGTDGSPLSLTESPIQVARIVARSGDETCELVRIGDDSNDTKSVRRDDGSANQPPPVLQGFDEDCSPREEG